MKEQCDAKRNVSALRDKIIGLGERSIRKSYYPQLQKEADYLREKSAELLNMLADLEEAKKRLEESESTYRAIFENTGTATVIVEEDGTISLANDEFADLSGYSRKEIEGKKRWTEFVVEEDLERMQEFHRLRRVDPEAALKRYEFHFADRKGEIRNIFLTIDMIAGTTRSVASLLDITERERAKEALLASEQRYRLHFENASDVIYSYDTELEVLSVSPSVRRILVYTPEELVGKSFMELNVLAPESLESALSDAMRTLAGERVTAAEYVFVAKDGTRVFGEVSGAPIERDGNVVGVVSVARDITKRKQAEEALRASEQTRRLLIDESPLGIAIIRNGIRVYANPALARMYGFETQDELMSRPATEFIDPEDRELVAQMEKDLLLDKDVQGSYEIRAIRKNGECFDMTLWPRKITYLGEPAVLSFVADTSESGRLKAQLVRAQKMEAIGTLAGGIAHDFNNLLNIILGYSELILSDRREGDQDYADLQAIRQAASRATDLVKRILTFSRRVETNRRPLDLNVEVKRARELLSRTIPKMITIELLLDDDLKNIDADPGQIEQILLNLAVNARHAIGERNGRIAIETKRAWLDEDYCRCQIGTKPGEYVLLAVSDTGHGMKKEVLDHIFEPFFTTKKPGEGTGLGLAMVFGIVQGHGGHITCYSEPGLGTTFKMYFPVIETEAKHDEGTKEVLPECGTETILIVDDEDLIRDLGRRLLSRAGYTALVASNGREALEIYRNKKQEISLVILDLIMPQMGGIECLEKLLQIDPNAKVIIASGHLPEDAARESIRRNAKGFVGKPYELKELLQEVREVLDH